MRSITLSRTELQGQGERLDPPFYLRREDMQALIEHEESSYAPLGDLLMDWHDGGRLAAHKDGMPVLSLRHLKPCEVVFPRLKSVVTSLAPDSPIQPGDVLFTRSAIPFRAAVVPHAAPLYFTVSQEIIVLKPHPAVVPEYLAAILSTEALAKVLDDLAYRRSPTALKRLRADDLALLPISLPPRSIQEEIKQAYLQAANLTAQAQQELAAIYQAIHGEIDFRLDLPDLSITRFVMLRSYLKDRLDFPYAKSRIWREKLLSQEIMRPLLSLAKPVPSSLKGIDEEDLVLAIQAEHINETTFLVEEASPHRLKELSARMRQPLAKGDVIICTTGAGQQIAYLDESLNDFGLPLLGSATFTGLRFRETPRYFALALAHPVVRQQMSLLATGSAQRFINKKDLDDLLVPCLATVWREDFDNRIERSIQRRREALVAKAHLLATAEAFVREGWKT